MIKIPGQTFWMGSSHPSCGYSQDHESPQSYVQVDSFLMDETPVTNEQFKEFVDDTGYVTEAERFGWSYVFHLFLTSLDKMNSQSVPGLEWWYGVPGASWLYPEGKQSVLLDRLDHPVTQVSKNDAVAYCQWAGKRLPTEAEWELAAKGGTLNEKFPWGDDSEDLIHFCNTWQGAFPYANDAADGYIGTAPVRTYPTNGYGLYQMIGNVWEWCCNPARIPLEQFNQSSPTDYWQQSTTINDEMYAVKGGSFLCHDSYCKRYRIAARNGASAMSASNHMGFRCVKDV